MPPSLYGTVESWQARKTAFGMQAALAVREGKGGSPDFLGRPMCFRVSNSTHSKLPDAGSGVVREVRDSERRRA